MQTPLERIAATLERIADNMDAAKVLEERRRRNREHMAAVRALSRDITPAERNEEGKEENPPCTPLKEKDEEDKKELPSSRAHARGFDDLFDRFWRAYPGPRKTDKRKCRAKFAAILRDCDEPESMLRRILDGIERWRRSRDWTEDGGDYICELHHMRTHQNSHAEKIIYKRAETQYFRHRNALLRLFGVALSCR